MRRVSVLSILVVAMCVASAAIASTSASATETKAEWLVNGVGLKPGEAQTIAEAIPTKTNWVFKQTTGAGIAVECNKVSFVNSFPASRIIGLKEATFAPMLFEGCKVTAPAGDKECEVESTGFPNGQIRTQALGFNAVEALEGPTSKPFVRFVPNSSEESIVVIKLIKPAGKTCTEASLEVNGIWVGKMDSCKSAKVHKLEFGKTTGTRLTIGGEEGTFTGVGEFAAGEGHEWGCH